MYDGIEDGMDSAILKNVSQENRLHITGME